MASTETLLGKKVSDLQENIKIDDKDAITGKLKYVANFDSYSKGASGYFLCIKVVEATKGDTVTVKVTGTGASNIQKTLDSDGIVICKIGNNDNKITIGNSGKTKDLTVTGLTLEASEAA